MFMFVLFSCQNKEKIDTANEIDPIDVEIDYECQLIPSDYGEEGTVDINVRVVTQNLTVPWGIAFLPDSSMLVTERDGWLRKVDASGNLQSDPITIVDVTATGEGGLLGIVLHPDFASNRFFYIYYTSDAGGVTHNTVERWTLSEDERSAEFEREIVPNIPSGRFHNGGRLRIGPDEKLYVTTGDARDPELSQDPNSLAGNILRVELDGSIPTDNPEPSSAIWVMGLRNSQGIDWRDDGIMVLTDHGPSGDLDRYGHDEINVAKPGDNLGWPDIYACEEDENLHSPSMTWTNAMPPGGHAIYKGTEIPEWENDVFIGVMGINDPDVPHLHRIRISDEGQVTLSEYYLRFEESYGRLRDVIMGPDGGLYITTSNCDGRGVCGDGDLILRVGRE